MANPVLAKLGRIIAMEKNRNEVAAEISFRDRQQLLGFMEELFVAMERRGLLRHGNARVLGHMFGYIQLGIADDNMCYRSVKGIEVDEAVNRQNKTIDRSLCDACGKCVCICKSSRVIAKDPDGFPRYAFLERCIDCGHCLAICPKGAISFARDGAPGRDDYYAEARVLDGDGAIADPVLRLLCALRSTRFFDEREVEREKLQLVLDSMVRAPSAGNEQNRSFYVFASRSEVAKLEADTREHYRRSSAQFANPVVAGMIARAMARKDLRRTVMRNRMLADLPRKEKVSAYVELFRDLAERPKDPAFNYFGGAAATILVTSNTNTEEFHKNYHKSDVELAVTYGTIAAAALGMASCRMGLSGDGLRP